MPLTELLAVAQLDAEKNHRLKEEAEVKVEALKWELVRLLRGKGASVFPSAVQSEEEDDGRDAHKKARRSPVQRGKRLTPPPRAGTGWE